MHQNDSCLVDERSESIIKFMFLNDDPRLVKLYGSFARECITILLCHINANLGYKKLIRLFSLISLDSYLNFLID